jgi:hypothetical protein
MTTPQRISDTLAAAVVGLLLSYWIIWAFSWYSLLFLPFALWEVYAIATMRPAALLTHAFMRLLRMPLVGAVLGGAVWYFFLSGQGKEVHRAALAVGLLVHFVFQNTIAYKEVWGEADTGKYGRVRVEGKEFLPGEPIFIIRGTDSAAADILYDIERRYGQSGNPQELREAISRRVAAVLAWQQANPTHVKLAD